jgi:hypothetical protein
VSAPVEQTDAPRVLLDEDFEGTRFVMWTGEDDGLKTEVVDGVFRLEVLNEGETQVARATFPKSVDGLRFEATITFEGHTVDGFGVGCWSGDQWYEVVITGDRTVGAAEMFSSSAGGLVDPRPIVDIAQTPAANPVGHPNRVRIDCVSDINGGWFSAYVNGTPVGSAPIPGDVGGFDAVGFTGRSEFAGGAYLIDDMVAMLDRPPPADAASDLEIFPDDAIGQTWFEHAGVRFSYPDNWRYVGGGEEEAGVTAKEIFEAILPLVTPASGEVSAGPIATTITGQPAFSAEISYGQSGQDRIREVAVVFGQSALYVLQMQYSPELELPIRAVWDEVLSSFEATAQPLERPAETGRPAVTGDFLPQYESSGQDPAVGLTAPTVIGENFNGEPVTISSNGSPTAIAFLAHWCSHCMAEVSAVQAWLDAGGGVDGVRIVSVSTSVGSDRPNYPPSEWLDREGWTPEVVLDDVANSVHTAFGYGNFPYWVFVNGDGTVAARTAGELDIDTLEQLLSALEQ